MNKKEVIGHRINEVINQKLKIACSICGITAEDTKKGIKHINKYEIQGKLTYSYAEMNVALVVVTFTDKEIKIRRIRRVQYWFYKGKHIFNTFMKWV